MKKFIAIFALICAATTYPVQAATPKTLAIIDTGVDISHPAIKNNIMYEVCISYNNSCPNKTNFQEGAGSATVTPAMYVNSQWNHGTAVASAAVQANSDIQIIEIRCASLVNASGYIGCNNDMLISANSWILANKDKFNIGAVVAPIGTYNIVCNTSASYVPSINKLINANVAVLYPTGNDFKYTAISNPACLPGVLAISAIDDKNRLALYANYSPRVDFAAPGNLNIAVPGGTYKSNYGTSLSVAYFGSAWIKIANVKNLSYTDQYNLIKKTSDPYTNIMVKQYVLALNMPKAIQ